MQKTFDTGDLIQVRFDEKSLLSFLVKLDLKDDGAYYYPTKELAEVIMRALPEYVFAHHEGVDLTSAVAKLKEAANRLYKTGDYEIMKRYYVLNDQSVAQQVKELEENSRGEFGELLLHLLLRDFKGTIPLVSKVYFSDARNIAAHGFDAVHFTPSDMTLWLGECKLYGDCNQGLNALIGDLKEHFTKDYMHDQFIVIKKNVESESFPERDVWIERLQKCERLEDMITNLNVVLLCVYPFDYYDKALVNGFTDKTPEEYYNDHIVSRKAYFDSKNDAPLAPRLNITLFLFPVKDKVEFVKNLHEKLYFMQNI